MPTQRVRKILDFLRENVRRGVDSIVRARDFVARMRALSAMEREFLELGLRDRKHLDELCSRFPPEEGHHEPVPHRPVATMRPCGLLRSSTDEQHLSAG